MRLPSGIAATDHTASLCPAQVLTRLLLATFHTLTVRILRAADDVLTVGRHRHRVTDSPLKVWTSVPSTWYMTPVSSH